MTRTTDTPNLDCMTPDELQAYSDSQSETSQTAAYARFAIVAHTARLEGDIQRALFAERCMDRIYSVLPEAERW